MFDFIKKIFSRKSIIEATFIDPTTKELPIVEVPILEKRDFVSGSYCIEHNTINDVIIVDIPCEDVVSESKFDFEIDVDAMVTLLKVENKKSIQIMVTSFHNLPSTINVKYKEKNDSI